MHSNNVPNRGPEAPADLAPYIDHTFLKAEATAAEIDQLCDEALKYKFKGVCVNSIHIARAAKRLQGSDVLPVSVVGFPLGAMISEAKAFETEKAVQAGAREIDMVIALGALKAGDWNFVEADIRNVVIAAGKAASVKVILETGLLSDPEIVHACKASQNAGALFVKTATGFLGRGASIDDVRIMRGALEAKTLIKASGGIKTFAQAQALIQAGAVRLGTSSGVALVTGKAAGAGY